MIFAGCLGRYSAEMEHEWMLGRDGDDAKATREVFVSLLEATMDENQAKQVLAHRIASKLSQSSLLSVASFSRDTERASRAAELRQIEIANCRRLLLDS